MDEQRLPAYMELIQQLLQCPQGEEARLLQAHSHLVDGGLVATMAQVATLLEGQGNGDSAQRLRLAAQGAEALGLQQAAPQGAEVARQFLLETLQLIADQGDNPQHIYPLWAQQQSRFNPELLTELPGVAAQLLQENKERRIFIATTLQAFGDLIREFPLGLRWLNLELSIAAYTASLEVFTRENLPVEWAGAQMNLASAYYLRIQGDRAQNIEDAIAAYTGVLEVFKPDLLPNDCRKAARGLGDLYFEQTQWQGSVSAYQTALAAAETLYQSANLLDSQAAELSETADLPRRAAYALARVGDLQKAVETLEQGRARGLSESLNRDRADLTQLEKTHPKLYQNYQEIANQLRNLEAQQRDRLAADRHSLTPEALRDRAIALRQQLTDTIQQIRQIEGYGQFLSLPGFADIQQAVQGDSPLVYLVATPAGSLALIVTTDKIHDLWLDSFNETQLIELLNQTWFAAYGEFQRDRQGWFEAIDSVTRQLWQPLMAPIITYLQQYPHQQVILIPTGYLSLLPLHAAWTEDPSLASGRRYALDDIHFTYVPNARSLTAARAIAQAAAVKSMLAIDNPRQDLPNSAGEVAAAIASFSQPVVLPHDQATVAVVKDQLPTADIAHFACHGTANLTDPLNSGLVMSDGRLTLGDIFALNLAEQGGLRLAILSACETGMIGTENADEAISLPTGLLQAGVAAVIASLWSVSDLSTMMLLSRFYDLWRTNNQEPSQALRQAQRWLRDLTEAELAPLLGMRARNPKNCYFSHPYHWAAFSYTGP